MQTRILKDWRVLVVATACIGVQPLLAEEAITAKALCDKAVTIPSVQYERLITYSPKMLPSSTRVRRKGARERIDFDLGQQSIIITPEGIYQSHGVKEKWKLLNDSPGRLPSCDWMTGNAELMTVGSEKIIGTETVDGKECVILELTGKLGLGTFKAKEWIWKQNGLEVQSEVVRAMDHAGSVVTRTANRRFEFTDIPDDVFAVPKDNVMPSRQAR